jgi:hypothetical protein
MINDEGRGYKEIEVGPFNLERSDSEKKKHPATAKVRLINAPLPLGHRGCVMVPQVHIRYEFEGKHPRHFQDTSTDVAALLLFDRLDYPLDGTKPNTDEIYDWLREQEFFQRSRVNWEGRDPFSGYTTVAALTAFEREEPGLWCIMRGADVEALPLDELEPHAAFQLKLLNALPIPAKDVPLVDVLEFKAARRSELMAMRHYLEELCLAIQREPNRPLVEIHALERFDKAMSDYARAVRGENRLAKAVSSLSVKMNWDKVVGAAVATGTLSQAGMSLTGAACSAFGAFAVGISVESTLGWRRSKGIGPFEYLAKVERELF